MRFMQGATQGIAHEVHLAGAAMGALYRFVDLRWSTFTAPFSHFRAKRRARRAWGDVPPRREGPSDGVPRFLEDLENQRLDRILEKISQFGRESLSEDEMEFLDRVSERYRGRH